MRPILIATALLAGANVAVAASCPNSLINAYFVHGYAHQAQEDAGDRQGQASDAIATADSNNQDLVSQVWGAASATCDVGSFVQAANNFDVDIRDLEDRLGAVDFSAADTLYGECEDERMNECHPAYDEWAESSVFPESRSVVLDNVCEAECDQATLKCDSAKGEYNSHDSTLDSIRGDADALAESISSQITALSEFISANCEADASDEETEDTSDPGTEEDSSDLDDELDPNEENGTY